MAISKYVIKKKRSHMFEQTYEAEASTFCLDFRHLQTLKVFDSKKNTTPKSCLIAMKMQRNATRPRFSRKFIDPYPIQSKLALIGGV